MRFVPILLLTLALPGTVGAQAEPSTSQENRVSATAAVLLKAGSVAGATRTHLGGWGGLRFMQNLAIGGGGFTVLKSVGLEGPEGETGFNLDMGYGGIFFRYWEPLSGPLIGEVGLLLGAGHGEVRDQLTRREVGSDNFLVAEAEMAAAYRFFHRFFLGASVGYRLTAGVEDLPGVSQEDFNSFTATLSLRVGGR